MCVQTFRRHMCRHCRSEWTAADFLELCPEGDKCVLKHGYCAPVVQILGESGHHVSIGRSILPPPPPQQHQQQQQQHNVVVPPSHAYPLHQRNPSESADMGGPGILEDMCEDCKEKHYREWAIEARVRQEQQLQQQQQQQQQQQAQQHMNSV
ncbi:hypothetical protein NLU13_2064 [Sarocladium strictum]|uniref:Uncharacterized protein n=1 Tax=Sarocladium strictum TaxID=5046 RepID=A0AA39LD37_SARSR|nr:hypothetical protein NLU13_2064 [Sarocladium strictum]